MAQGDRGSRGGGQLGLRRRPPQQPRVQPVRDRGRGGRHQGNVVDHRRHCARVVDLRERRPQARRGGPRQVPGQLSNSRLVHRPDLPGRPARRALLPWKRNLSVGRGYLRRRCVATPAPSRPFSQSGQEDFDVHVHQSSQCELAGAGEGSDQPSGCEELLLSAVPAIACAVHRSGLAQWLSWHQHHQLRRPGSDRGEGHPGITLAPQDSSGHRRRSVGRFVQRQAVGRCGLRGGPGSGSRVEHRGVGQRLDRQQVDG